MTRRTKNLKGLPHTTINALLTLTLVSEWVHVSDKAMEHMRARHPDDFDQCAEAMPMIISEPDYVGQSPLHPDNFVLVKEWKEVAVLVAISTNLNEYGKYPVLSAYLIPHDTLQRRLRKGYFKRIV